MTLMNVFFCADPPWSMTRKVPQCHFHLNVNLKAISLRPTRMLTCFESRFASQLRQIWWNCELLCHKINTHSSFSGFSKELLQVVFCSLVKKVFVHFNLLCDDIWHQSPWKKIRQTLIWLLNVSLFFRLVDCSALFSESIAYFLLIMQSEYSVRSIHNLSYR